MPAARSTLGLLAAAAEHERVAALQAHDLAPGGAVLEQQRLDLLLGHRRAAALLADVEQLGVGARAVERRRPGSGGRRRSRRPRRSARARARSAGPGRRARRRRGRRSRRHARASAWRSSSAAPAASIRSAQAVPTLVGVARSPRRAARPSRRAGRPTPRSVRRPSPARRACAPTGVWQEAPSACDERALGRARRPSPRVVDRRAARSASIASRAGLSASAPWPGGGHEARSSSAAGLAAAAQALAARRAASTSASTSSVGELAQPRVDVAAQLDHLEVVAQRRAAGRARRRLLVPTRRARRPASASDGGAADARRAASARARDADQLEAVGQLGRDVLGRVHGEVDAPVQQRPLELARPSATCRRRAAPRSPQRGDLDDLDRRARGARPPSAPAPAPARCRACRCASAASLTAAGARAAARGPRARLGLVRPARRRARRRRARPPPRQPEQLAHELQARVAAVVVHRLHLAASARAAGG